MIASGYLPRSSAVACIVLANTVILILTVTYGFEFALDKASFGAIARLMAGAIAVMIVLHFACLIATAPRESSATRDHGLPEILCLLQISLTLFFATPTRWAVPAILLVWLVGGLLRRFIGSGVTLIWAMACGFILYVGSILITPPEMTGGDMLPFISHAIDVYAAGGDPYTADFSMITANPFFYPPVQWLVFLPARLARLDLRVVNVVSAVLMVVLVEWRVAVIGPLLRAAVYPVMLCPLALTMMRSGQIWPYWLAILAMGLLALERRWRTAAVLAAIAIGLRPTAMIPALAVFMALFGRVRMAVIRDALALAVVTIVATNAPFLSSAADLRFMLTDGPRLALSLAHGDGNPGNQIALSNLIDWLGFARWDSAVEIVLTLLAAVAAWFAHRRGVPVMISVAGFGYVMAVSANGYFHSYYDIAGILLAATGASAIGRTPTQADLAERITSQAGAGRPVPGVAGRFHRNKGAHL